MKITVKVPATSANIGSGFDSLGLALNMYNKITVSHSDTIDITSSSGDYVPTGPENIIYATIKNVHKKFGKELHGLKIVQEDNIPMTRGLGSSSACIVSGLLCANELLGKPMTKDELLTLATHIEGHPDNVAPAILGGFVSSVYDGKKVYSLKKDVPEDLQFAAFIPNFKLPTKEARGVLPKIVPHKDAVFNLSRSAMLAVAFCEERYDLLSVATKDALHQQYRLPLIEGGAQMFELTEQLGALATYISGAGPTILSIVHKDNSEFFTKAQNILDSENCFIGFELHKLSVDNTGAIFDTI